MKTASTILRFFAMFWWCGIALVFIPYFLIKFPENTARNIRILPFLMFFAGLSLVPHEYLLRRRRLFWPSIGVAFLPFAYLTYVLATTPPGRTDDGLVVLVALAILTGFLFATLCLPLSLLLGAVASRRQRLESLLSQQGAPPNGGPAKPLGSSGVGDGPPSVS